MTEERTMTTETPKWLVAFTPDSPKRTVEAFIDHADALALRLPSVAVIFDPRADDVGPQGLVDYLNALETRVARAEARAALADVVAEHIRGNWRYRKWADWLARYDALDQSTEEA